MSLFRWITNALSGSSATEKEAAQADLPHEPDNGVRMHIAANDPAFPAQREAAIAAINAAIEEVALAHGFTTTPRAWVKSGPLGRVSVHLQRGTYGFEASINLGFQPSEGEPCGPWAEEGIIRLGEFYPSGEDQTPNPGALIYLDVIEDPNSLDQPMQILSDRALPWLLAHLTEAEPPALPVT